MHARLIFSVGFLFSSCYAFSQIPAQRMTDWSQPGSADPFVPVTVLSILDFGADASGVQACDSSLQEALSALNGPGKLLFPAGTYLFNQTVALPDSVILEGQIDTATLRSQVLFKLNPGSNSHGISIQGSETDLGITTQGTLTQGMYKIYVPQAANLLQPGDYIRLYAMDDSSLVYSSWALHQTGQIVKIVGIANDSLELGKPLRRSYDVNRPPRIYRQQPRRQAHLQCINLERVDQTASQTSNVWIEMATDCSLNGVDSYRCNFAHVTLQTSSRITVRYSHFHEAFAYGGGGQGYGVVLQSATSDCYVYANAFTHLRHFMLLQSGVNGNVLAYNYSTDPFWTEPILPANSAGDLVLHGNYPYMNLFEGNVVQNIIIDNSHGLNGPFNTVFRNRAELYGIFMNTSPASPRQNFVGNQVTSANLGFYALQGTDHYEYGNSIKGALTPAGSSEYAEASLYGYVFPSYYEAYTGTAPVRLDTWQSTIPLNEAAYRYTQNKKSVCAETVYENPFLAVDELPHTEVSIYPNPAQDWVTIAGEGITRVELLDLLGKPQTCTLNNGILDVSTLPAGTYVLVVYQYEGVCLKKLLLTNP